MLGIIPAMPEAEYHAHPALSSTGARMLLDSPARFHYAQTHPRADKDEFDLGSAVHSKVLGTGYEIAVLDFPDWRSKSSQKARDKARAEGKIPVLTKTTAAVDAIAEAVLAHPTARSVFEQDGIAEASAFATDPTTEVDLRARFDYLAPICVDLKTIGTRASTDQFAKSIFSYGYDVQQAHYLDTLELLEGERRQMVFVVVETEAPYLVAVHQLDRDYTDMGVAKARRARELYAECTRTGVWPGYPTGVHLVLPPMYAVYDFQDNYQ